MLLLTCLKDQEFKKKPLYSYIFFFNCACFGSTYTKIGTIQRRLAWPLRKDDTQNREAFHIFEIALLRLFCRAKVPFMNFFLTRVIFYLFYLLRPA
jgi:hypothetical protein